MKKPSLLPSLSCGHGLCHTHTPYTPSIPTPSPHPTHHLPHATCLPHFCFPLDVAVGIWTGIFAFCLPRAHRRHLANMCRCLFVACTCLQDRCLAPAHASACPFCTRARSSHTALLPLTQALPCCRARARRAAAPPSLRAASALYAAPAQLRRTRGAAAPSPLNDSTTARHTSCAAAADARVGRQQRQCDIRMATPRAPYVCASQG